MSIPAAEIRPSLVLLDNLEAQANREGHSSLVQFILSKLWRSFEPKVSSEGLTPGMAMLRLHVSGCGTMRSIILGTYEI